MESKYPRLVIHQQRALALVRIWVGLWFLYAVSGKLAPGFVADFPKTLNTMLAGHPPDFYAGFLKEVVIPNAGTFAYMVILGELTTGILLVLGLFTGPACILGIFLNMNFLFAAGPMAQGINLTFIVVQIALALGYAGTTWGLDRAIVEKMPWWFAGLLHYEYREF
jgi:thiosulfate dehydrogenase [quinone] large subunit